MPKPNELIPPKDVLPSYAQGRNFKRAGRRFVRAAVEHGLEPDNRVLELGCGPGRFAVALSGHLSERGSYIGLDTSQESIDICKRWIGAKLPRFQFAWADVFNARYNEVGNIAATEYRFPCDDGSVDFVFSNSLFTHLRPADAAHYLDEIGRVLKPGGRTLNTMFLINDEALGLLAEKDHKHGKLHRYQGVARVKSRKHPERWIGFDEEFIQEAHLKAGLRIDETRYGAWPGRGASGIGGKDAVVAVKS